MSNAGASWALAVFFTLYHPILVRSVCYEPFGCFDLEPDFFHPIIRPILKLPQSPDTIQTKFFIYSKRIQLEQHCPGHFFTETTVDPEPNTWPACLIDTDDLLDQTVLNETLQSISNSNQPDETAWTAFVIHGWITSVDSSGFMYELKNRLLHNQARPYDTVVLVDWSQGADGHYLQACANIRLVGAQIAYFIRQLMRNVNGINVKNIHVLGHSLGAHAAGYVGAHFSGKEKLARVTALDPAGPLFDNQPEKVQVNKDDADFVDVIHTSGFSLSQIGLGMKHPTGHLDFYPNNGKDQPGCECILSQPRNKTSCDHARAHQLFIHSIPLKSSRSCSFQSVQCFNWNEYQNDKCLAKNLCFISANKHCAKLGFFAYEWAERRMDSSGQIPKVNSSVIMYLNTTGEAPYC